MLTTTIGHETKQALSRWRLEGVMNYNRKWFSVLPSTSPVIILGMHRSGTSLLTGLLAECGIFFGNDLDQNHESRTFKNLNEYLFNSVGGNWDYPYPLEVLEKDIELRELYLEYLRGQIKSPRCIGYFGWGSILKPNPIHWGWKDPRNSFTLGIWNEVYPTCKVILIERHGVDVALSLMKRRKKYLSENIKKFEHRRILYSLLGKKGTFVDTARCWSLVESVKLWSEYSVKARVEISRLPKRNIFIKYENFVSDPVKFTKKILEFLGVALNDKSLGQIFAKVNTKRAFAYRVSETFLKLKDTEKAAINDLLTPAGYDLD